jgi:hypothetical protein
MGKEGIAPVKIVVGITGQVLRAMSAPGGRKKIAGTGDTVNSGSRI